MQKIIKINGQYYAEKSDRPYYKLVNNQTNATKYDHNTVHNAVLDAKRYGFEDAEIEIIDFDRYANHVPVSENDNTFEPNHMAQWQIEELLDKLTTMSNEAQNVEDVKAYLYQVIEGNYQGNTLDKVNDLMRDVHNWLGNTLGIDNSKGVTESQLTQAIEVTMSKVDKETKSRIYASSAAIDLIYDMHSDGIQRLKKVLKKIIR